MKDERERIFSNLKNIAAAVGKTFGRNCEVAIHDFARLPNSLIHIEGTLTKRKPGAPITDLVVKAIRHEGNKAADIYNYKTVIKDGRILKSSTAFIRDMRGNIIGAFCLNFCVIEYLNAVALLEEFTRTLPVQQADSQPETFATSLNETIESLMNESIKKFGKQPATMNKEEKIELIAILEFQGAFLIKGAVEYVAKAIGVSKFSVYNYLKEVRTNQI